jgi:ferric-dicitrate binding protein FerR (iron transport regulator)
MPDYAALIGASDSIRSDNVSLVMPDRRIEISSDTACLVYNRQGEVNINARQVEQPSEMNQLVVPYGKSSSLVLADGTKVWVNSGSRLIYPSVFAGDSREIYVEGEAFLDVSHDEGKPFVVRTSKMNVRVMGTRFNVTAFSGDSSQSVVLVSGSVRVSTSSGRGKYDLTPNQRLANDIQTGYSSVEQVDAEEYTSWVDGYLSFRSRTLDDVLRQLQRYFNTKIDYDPGQVENIRVSGKLDLKCGIDEALEFISLTTTVNFVEMADGYRTMTKP